MSRLATIPWLKFAGLTATAWAVGALYTWAQNGGGRAHFYGDISSLLLAIFGAFAPVALALLWMWPAASRPQFAAGAVILAGIIHTVVFVTGPRDPGAEYLDDWALYTLIAGTGGYAVMSLVAWFVLWLVARALHQQPAI